MNWISKLVIVLTCSVALLLPSSPATARSSSDQTRSAHLAKEKKTHSGMRKSVTRKKKSISLVKKSATSPKKITAKQGSSRRANVVSRVKTKGKTTKAVAKQGGSRLGGSKRSTAVIARSSKAKSVARSRRANSIPPATRSLAVAGAAVANPSSLRITARSAMIMDALSGEPIYAQASDTPAQPASTIKVLTGVISLDVLPKNELVPVSRRAAMMPRSKVYLSPGKKYPANDLINAVLLASANDASVALAEKIAGSEQAFAKMMTAKARSFGATNTVCKTANGLTASGQYTTAHDLAKIFNNAMRNNEFASKMAVTEVVNTDGKVIKSHNRALWQVDGAEGGKTGYTDVARKTYVGKFKRDNDEIIVSLMGSERMWEDVKRLVEYGFAKKRTTRGATARTQPADSPRLAIQLPSSPRRLSQLPSL